MKLFKKLSYKIVCGEPAPGTATMRVAAVIRKIEKMATQYGESVAFIGDIAAVNLATGEQVESTKIYLPRVAEDFLLGLFEQGKNVEGFQALNVVLDIDVIESEKSSCGYEFTVDVVTADARKSEAVMMLEHISGYGKLPDPSTAKHADG